MQKKNESWRNLLVERDGLSLCQKANRTLNHKEKKKKKKKVIRTQNAKSDLIHVKCKFYLYCCDLFVFYKLEHVVMRL